MSQLKALRQKLAEMCCEYGAHREENVGPKKQVKGEQLKKLSTVMRKRAEMEGAADYAVPAVGVVSPGLAAILSAVQAPAGAGWSHAGRTFGGGMLGGIGGGALGSALGGLAGHSELGNLIGAVSGSALGSHMGHQSAKAKAKEPASEVQKLSALLKQTAAPAVAAATPQKPMLQGPYWDKIRSIQKPRAPAAPMAPAPAKQASEMTKLSDALRRAVQRGAVTPNAQNAARLTGARGNEWQREQGLQAMTQPAPNMHAAWDAPQATADRAVRDARPMPDADAYQTLPGSRHNANGSMGFPMTPNTYGSAQRAMGRIQQLAASGLTMYGSTPVDISRHRAKVLDTTRNMRGINPPTPASAFTGSPVANRVVSAPTGPAPIDFGANRGVKTSVALEKLSHTLKQAGFMPMLGKGLSMAGRAAGIVPGVGTAAGAVMGGIGGAISAPPGKRMMGAGLGAATGAMGPIAGTAANMVGSHVLGV